MESLKKIIDELTKHSLLVYFVIIWGASMFLYAVCNLGTWGFGVEDIYDLTWILANLFDLAAGVLLMIFGLKLMNTDFLDLITIEKTLVYFLILWAKHSLKGNRLQYVVSAESCRHNIYNLYTLLLIYIKIIDKYHYICIINCNFIVSYVTNRNWRQLE